MSLCTPTGSHIPLLFLFAISLTLKVGSGADLVPQAAPYAPPDDLARAQFKNTSEDEISLNGTHRLFLPLLGGWTPCLLRVKEDPNWVASFEEHSATLACVPGANWPPCSLGSRPQVLTFIFT